MLAQLLRRVIATQMLIGAGLGFLLFKLGHGPVWGVLAWAAAMPFVGMILIDIVTAVQSRGNEGIRVWWRSLFGEFNAGIQVFLFRQPWAIAPPTWQPATGGVPKIPVVLVHGFMCNHRIWDDMANALRANGHPVFAVDLEPLFASIDNYTPIVENAVKEICRQTGASRVALVGHSMGGLAIRAWMRSFGSDRVARILTLGTPHAGTRVGPFFKTANGTQMGWKSQWLADLAASESDAVRALKRIAITPQDNIVYPQRAQVLQGITPTAFDGIGHVQMCINVPVIQWVVHQLDDLPPA